MQSTLSARDADPHDTFLIEPNVVLAARADAADANRREPDLRALVSEISAGVAAQTTAPKVDTSFRGNACRNLRYQRSEEHTSELQSQFHLVCRLLLEK